MQTAENNHTETTAPPQKTKRAKTHVPPALHHYCVGINAIARCHAL
jgi:hypothetical protein